MFKHWDKHTKRLWLFIFALGLFLAGVVLLSNGTLPFLQSNPQKSSELNLNTNTPLAIRGINSGNSSGAAQFWQQGILWDEKDWFEVNSAETRYVVAWDGAELTPLFTLPAEASFVFPFDTKYLLYATGDPSQLKWVDDGIAQDLLTLKPAQSIQDLYFNPDRKELFTLFKDVQGQVQFAEISVKKELTQLANLGLGEWQILGVSTTTASFKNVVDNSCASLDMLTKQRVVVECPSDGIQVKNAASFEETSTLTLKDGKAISLNVGEVVSSYALSQGKVLLAVSIFSEGITPGPVLAAPEFTYMYTVSDLSTAPQKVDLPPETFQEIILDKKGQFILVTDQNLYLFEDEKWVKIESNLCLSNCEYILLDK